MSFLPIIFDMADELAVSPLLRLNRCDRRIHPSELEIICDPNFLHSLGLASHRPHCLQKAKMSDKKNDSTTADLDGFQVSMNVQDFAPNEISVKTVDQTILVEGKHEERPDQYGSISRQFSRRYNLPDGYDAKDVFSQLSSDGVLTIKAPPQPKPIAGNIVRIIQIQQTGPTNLNVGNKETIENKEDKHNKEQETTIKPSEN